MSFSRLLIIISLYCLCLAQKSALAIETNPSDRNLSLMIKPITCVVKNLGEQCKMKANVAWQSSILRELCLFQENERIKCWSKRSAVSELIEVTLNKTMIFSLRNKKQQALLEQTVKVHALSSQKYRRKLKSDWSLF